MPRAQLINNARTTLASGVTNSATTFTVATGGGAAFPTTGYFYLTLLDSSNIPEVVKCTNRSIDIFTVERAQDGTTARAFATGTTVSLNLTAAVINELLPISDAVSTYATITNTQNSTHLMLSSVSGTNSITGNLTPAITAYTVGQAFRFISAGANTGAVTININGLGAKAITKSGATALSSGDIPAGAAVTIIYDGTQFQLSSGAGSSSGGGGGGGATGAGTDQVFYENDKLATGSYTIGNASINIACTFTNGSAVVTAANTFVADQPVRFNTAGTLPTNFSTSAFYYVISTGLSSSAFQVSSTIGGTAIVAGSAGTGTHTVGKVKDVMVNRVLAVATGQTITFPTGVVTQVVGGGTPGATDLYVSTVTNQTVGGNKTFTGTNTFTPPPTFSNRLAQIQTFQTGAVATGTTTIPLDDTIPQITEGDQYMTLAITPTNVNSTLEIDVTIALGHSVNTAELVACLFQDSTANAIAVSPIIYSVGTGSTATCGQFKHVMTAGTTSPTTFRVRAGSGSGGTTTFNGRAGSRLFGGTYASRITIKEYLP